jgi:outer membrane protein assembly factor BamB
VSARTRTGVVLVTLLTLVGVVAASPALADVRMLRAELAGTRLGVQGTATLGSPGVVKWRFQVSGQYVLHPPAVGPDGGVVVASSTGDVYSLTAGGTLRWVVPAVGADGGRSIGPDGTVYAASIHTITAIAADGSIRWRFTEPSSGQGVIAGPTVGPDGNIYVISDFGGLGAFALSPAGQLLWSNSGNPTFAEQGQLGAQVVFGSGRLFAAFDQRSVAPSTMFGLSLGGAQQWARPLGGGDDPFMQQQRQPATGADGSLYLTGMGGANGWSLFRVDPASGDVRWQRSPYPSNGMSAPSVGPDGSVYFSRSLSYLDSVTPAGRPRWTFSDGSIIDHPAVSPDGGVVVAGNRPDFGQPGWVRGWNAATGTLAWQVDLPGENGGYQVLYTQPRFSADSRTAYFGTAILGGGNQFSFLYAVESGTGAPPPTQCVVPGVVGMTIDAARAEIVAAGCSVGTVRRVRSPQVGIVLAQSPAPGTTLPPGGRVALTVGRR